MYIKSEAYKFYDTDIEVNRNTHRFFFSRRLM